MSEGTAHQAYMLDLDPQRVRELYARGGIELEGDPVEQLAQALASSSPLDTYGPWALSVRTGAPGLIAAIGEFTPGCVARLEAIRWQVEESLRRLRYLDDSAVLTACERLADALRRELGGTELREARFSAIPRGGHIVLGHLAYLLDLDPAQLDGPADDRPWVVVDDCSISGMRFREFLDTTDGSHVVFAHLCSHPDLRAAVEADERVRRCLAAEDLHDFAPEALGEGYPQWRVRWDSRQRGRHYWLGKPDHVCFPWSEPDVGIWNPVLEREDPGWRVVPPSFCLKNRVRYANGQTDLQTLHAAGPIRPAPGVMHVRLGDQVVAVKAGVQTATKLEGTAADMWHCLIDHGSIRAAVSALEQIYDVPATVLRTDLLAFLGSLGTAGLLDDFSDHPGHET